MMLRPSVGEAQANCVFQLGFETLRSMIPEIVGQCRENEWHNAFNGDGLQQTTGGLLVWRKCDNWTAFTNGSVTWINGPTGLVTRPNQGPLFPFEATNCAPVDTAPPPAAPPPAATSAPAPAPAAGPDIKLTISEGQVDAGEQFSIRIEASSPVGVESIWWWVTGTSDSDLRNTHTFDCNRASPCINRWDQKTQDTGTITIHAQGRDSAGVVAPELTYDLRVRSVDPTATPAPAATATPAPAPTSTPTR